MISLSRINKAIWLAIVGCSTIVIITSYAIAQQSTRLSANDLPKTTAQIIAHELDDKATPSDAIPKESSDLRNDNIPFAIITDGSGTILASSVSLDGKTVLPPAGTFVQTKKLGSDRFTWQPANGVRQATYMQAYGGRNPTRYIITGQSLTEFENRIGVYGELAILGWLAIILWATFALALETPRHRT